MAKDDWRSTDDMDEYSAKWRASHSEGETPSRIPRMWISYGTRNAPAAAVTSAATWSSADKNASVTISGAGLIATCGGSAAVNRAGRGTTATTTIGAGVNRFWKVTPTVAGANFGIGICTSVMTFADANYLGTDTEGLGWYPDGSIFYNNSLLTTGPSYAQGNTLMIACQGGGSGKLWLGVNGTWSGDPVAGTGGINNGFATCYPAYNLRLNDVATAAFALSDAPSGFSAFP